MADMLLEVKNLSKYYPLSHGFWGGPKGRVKAVDGVSLSVQEGETLGLVGESGCGKTTLGRCLVRGIHATAGEAWFYNRQGNRVDLLALSPKALKPLRKEIQMVFQDPYASLDPRMTVYDIIAEPLKVNLFAKPVNIDERVKYLASVVGLNTAHLRRYPHAFSGGQRQRIGIARALAPDPRLIVADEAVSALDVSVQAQVLNLLKKLQRGFGLTYIFVAHDLSVVEHISDRVAVMYVGRVVESAATKELFEKPRHPYTEALISAVPKPDPRLKMKRIILEGEVPNPTTPPTGCHFHPRCPYMIEKCRSQYPQYREVAPGHYAACHRTHELELRGVT